MTANAGFLFGVGAQKAGTTWLYSYFASHPQVHIQSVKEIHYFNVLWDPKQIGFRHNRENHLESLRHAAGASALQPVGPGDKLAAEQGDGGSYEETRRLVEMYSSQEPNHAAYRRLMLEGSSGKQWVADITPDYSVLSGQRYRQMAEAFPDSKFLFLLRDPVQRLWSHLKMRAEWLQGNGQPRVTASKLLRRVLAGLQPHFLDRSNYRGTLIALAKLPADRVKHMFYETMFSDKEIAGLCEFLGVDFHPGNYDRRVRACGGGAQMTDADRDTMRWLLAPHYRAALNLFGDAVPASWDRNAARAQMPEFLDRSQIHSSVLERLG